MYKDSTNSEIIHAHLPSEIYIPVNVDNIEQCVSRWILKKNLKLMECVLYLFTDDDLTVLLIPHSDLRDNKMETILCTFIILIIMKI